MREIKFRAWNGSKMIVPQENSYYQHYVSFCGGIIQKSSEGMECFGGGDTWRIVDNTILMQYTGLKDCNGVEIFEGDLITDHVGVGVIVWSDKNASLKVSYLGDNNGLGKWFADYNLKGEFESIKIIGNIHENPELLEREA